MKIFPKSRSNFHAARIDGWFFGTSGLLTFNRDNFRIHSLWKNSPFGTGERFRALFRSSDFFVIKYFWNRVVTYLWEREIPCGTNIQAITKKSELLKSALNRSPVPKAQFSHKLGILKLSLVKVRSPEVPKNQPSIRAA